MRILHTGDWHLGRLFFAHSLIDDQAHVLDQFVECIADRRPDVVVIAGDVYDRAVPPPEAVSLLDDVLCRIVVDLKVPVVLIAGNHDSADRLGFGSRLMASGLRIAGRLDARTEAITLQDDAGDVLLYALPYAEPAVVRDVFMTSVHDHDAALRMRLDEIRARHPARIRSVLVAHAFVTGSSESESERPLSVGGSGSVPCGAFDGFDYVALGHLHRPQTLKGRIRYAGSLLKYSLSEVDHEKTISMVELGPEGEVAIEEITLSARRDFRQIEGTLEDLLRSGRSDPRCDDYVYARLVDHGALLDPMARLRQVYPNTVALERIVLGQSGPSSSGPRAAMRTTTQLFDDFFHEVTGEPLEAIRRTEVVRIVEGLVHAEREAK